MPPQADSPEAPAARLHKITKRFPGVIANDRASFTLARGEIHALLGENGAGKSTLMNVLAGLYRPESGSIELDGASVSLRSPRDAINRGVGMVHQHFMLVSAQTVAENIVLGMSRPKLLLSRKKMAEQVAELAHEHGLDPHKPVWQMSVGEQQRVELVKALYRGARTLILDEPTAVLTPPQVRDLFEALRKMVAAGKSVVLISHKLGEVLDIADRVTVLQRGSTVADGLDAKDMTQGQLAHLMIGHAMSAERNAPGQEAPGDTRLVVRGLRALDDRGVEAVRGVSLEVKAGEIYGLAGVSGNGQRELFEALAGLRPIERGDVRLGTRQITNLTPSQRHQLGLSYVPEDRHATGTAPGLSITDNLMLKLSSAPELGSRWFLDQTRMRERAQKLAEQFDIALSDVSTAAGTLSGGNLQKVILARETQGDVTVLLAAQPTRGLDIGAARYVHEVLRQGRDRGTATLLISEDLEELLALCDRIGVIYQGEITGEMDARQADIDYIGELMTGAAHKTTAEAR